MDIIDTRDLAKRLDELEAYWSDFNDIVREELDVIFSS